jgi:soluble lytic murein transglycosylase
MTRHPEPAAARDFRRAGPRRAGSWRTFAMIGALLLGSAWLPAHAAQPVQAALGSGSAAAQDLHRQRAAYRQALNDLNAGRTAAFAKARQELADYPLAAYLDYYDASRRMSLLSDAEMQSLQARHGDLPAARILHFRWLKSLGARQEWSRLLANHVESEDVELNCLRLRALLGTGKRSEAMAGVPALWISATSRPKACDVLFEAWIAGGHLTEQHAWERLQLALTANERTLGRYLLRFFDGPMKVWAQALHDVHIDPPQVARLPILARDEAAARVVIAHGLRRLARQDPAAAHLAWQRYARSHAFDAIEAHGLDETVALALARQGDFTAAQNLAGRAAPAMPAAAEAAAAFSAGFAGGMAEAALAAQNWPELVSWIDRIPPDQRADLRWQYWLARALARTTVDSERARRTFQALAEERNYYGFLAAEQIGKGIRLNPGRFETDATEIAALQRSPAMARALELYAVGDLVNARRELYALIPTLPPAQRYHAVQLTQHAGWVPQSILLANTAELWDSLDLRFPVVYPEVFQDISRTTAVAKPFLLAVARQESVFDHQATSSANARGLMQLMHPTANQVARQLGRTAPSATDLFDPRLSIELGGHHLAKLLQRYKNRRPLAAAAYNAGEGRVDRWLRERGGQPMDVWIESIPFPETRNYVKNVLAFTQVYGQILSQPAPTLDQHETMTN